MQLFGTLDSYPPIQDNKTENPNYFFVVALKLSLGKLINFRRESEKLRVDRWVIVYGLRGYIRGVINHLG